MATPTQYTFTQQVLYTDNLVSLIQSSSIVTVLVNIETSGTGSSMSVSLLFKDVLSTEDQATLNTLMSSYTDQPLPVVQTIIPKVIQKLGVDSVILCPFGTTFLAAANQSTTFDMLISSSFYIKGGIMYSSPGNIGDFITVQIIDKNNIIGKGGTSDNPTILATYVNNWYVIPSILNEVEDISLSNEIPVGLYMRFIYTNTSPTINSQVVINIISYQGSL